MQRIILFIFTLLLLQLSAETGYAAFPVRKHEAAKTTEKKTLKSYLHAPAQSHEKYETLGAVALGLGIASIVTLIAGAVFLPGLLFLSVLCGIAAIVTGAMGKPRHDPFALTGMILGIVDVAILLTVAIIFLILVAIFGGF